MQNILIAVITGFVLMAIYQIIERIFNYKVATNITAVLFICSELFIYKALKDSYRLKDYGFGSYEYSKIRSLFFVIEIVVASVTYCILLIFKSIIRKK